MSLEIGMFLILLVATLITLFISILANRRRDQLSRYFALIMLAISFYSLGYGFEIISTSLAQAKFWLNVQYIGIPFISTFWLMMVMGFTGHLASLKKWVVPLLFIIPVCTLILYYTNDFHHLYYRDIQFEPDSTHLSSILLFKGPWYWIHITHSYLLNAISVILFIVMFTKALPIVRKQQLVLMFGAIAPWSANLIYVFMPDKVNMDMTPLGFTVTGLVYMWGIYRFNLLRLVPIAYQTIFETMQDGAVIIDDAHKITHVNQAAKEIFQPLQKWKGETVSVQQIFASHPDLLAFIHSTESGETRLSIRKGAETCHYQVKMSIMVDKWRITLGKIIIFTDMTQIVLYQEQLLTNAKQLKETQAFKDKLFAVITHDIRDPLALLINLTELIEEDYIDSTSEQSRVFREVSSRVRGTYLLVENLLDWFRSQKGEIHFKPLMWELEPIVRHVVHEIEPRAEIKQIRLSMTIQEDVHVYADKEMLEMILRNLLFNAIKFTETGEKVHLTFTRIADSVTISVRDSGTGVDPVVGQSLFHKVQEISSPGTDGEQGTGLGLYLCGKLVRLHGGDIWYESNPGRGSTFCFTLPVDESSSLRQRTRREVDA
ncbi:histidine kinase N-terminal 7TM domain-containing protein [Halalkalibacter oceani]|uniref:histidine kinase N-terminal 7TM domain-containing protein n=1 Tax=Halalkalibacter oceani TaxID=1653776 RepID=UPI003398A073